MKKIFALTAISVALLGAGCSSDDDDDTDMTDGGATTGMTDGMTDGGMEPMMATLPAGGDYDPAALDPAATLNLLELASSVPDLSTLVSAISNNNCTTIIDAIQNPDARLTVFAPNNAAFEAQEVQDALAADGADVCAVVAGHVLNDTVAGAADLAPNVGTVATTLGGSSVAIESDGADGLTVGGAAVVGADNFATNGVAHIISSVILPAAEDGGETGADDGAGDDTGGDDGSTGGGDGGPVATALNSAPGVTTFAGAFQSANFTGALDNAGGDGTPNTWTVFAPSNAALEAASLTGGDLDTTTLQRHIHTDASLSESELGGLQTITMTSGLGTYDVAVQADGSITVAGFPVTLITSGQSTVYQIEGILP